MKHRAFSLDRVPSQGEGGSPLPVGLPYPPPFVNAFLKKSLGIPGIKNIFEKMLTIPLSSAKILPMQKNWIPRSHRWSPAEREQKKLQAQNVRQIRWMFWRESQEIREQIQKEISEKLLAKRAAIE